jgi:hypothetical protein
MKIKNSNNNTGSNKQSKVVKPKKYVFDEYNEFFSGRLIPVSEAFVEKIAQELVIWAHSNDDALILSEFYLSRGIAPKVFHRWMEKFPVVKEAHDTALEIIGNRREKGGLNYKLHAGMVMYSAPLYKPQWKDLHEWRSQAANIEDKSKEIHIHMDPIPSTDLKKTMLTGESNGPQRNDL